MIPAPRFEMLPSTLLLGMKVTTSFSENRTAELWRKFMPRLNEIQFHPGSDLFAVEVYDAAFFDRFDPNRRFEKWAAVEVSWNARIPEGMQTLEVPEGLYAVFIHKGPASDGAKTYEHIFRTWLPESGYVIDHRPHFARMGELYKHDAIDSEEEIWVPVREE